MNNIREIKNIEKNSTVFESTWVAFKGYLRILRKETNIKILTTMTLLVLALALYLKLAFLEIVFVTYLWLFTLILEINNTTFEEDIDFTGDNEFHPAIKKVKDYAAATVLLSSTFSIIVTLICFLK